MAAHARTLLLVLCLAAAPALAQEPTGPPPPSGPKTSAGPEVHELLPDIGRIGAEVAVFAGPSWNPYRAGAGVELGGYADLPLFRVPPGKVSYQLFLGLSLARSEPFTVAARSVRTRLRLLHVSPFALKWTVTRLDHLRLRPSLAVGADVLLAFTRQEAADGGGLPFASQAPELAVRGVPSDQGSLALGGHAAAGLELRVCKGVSLNLEYRPADGDGLAAPHRRGPLAGGGEWLSGSAAARWCGRCCWPASPGPPWRSSTGRRRRSRAETRPTLPCSTPRSPWSTMRSRSTTSACNGSSSRRA